MDSSSTTDHLLSLNSSPRKLPIKRKIPPPLAHSSPTRDRRHAPFKFHRIWTEPDEIRFLQGLLESSSSVSFPRDLHLFFTRFSNTISHPYSKSQLSEKLRRLRKKWRVVSTRLAKGLDFSRLSPHDRTLFELSEKLWHPDFVNTSPFGAASACKSKIKVDLSPSIDDVKCDIDDNYCDEDVKLSLEIDDNDIDNDNDKSIDDNCGNEIGKIVAKTVVNVFDESLNYVKSGKKFCYGGENKCESFEKRWRELRVVEMEVLAQRLRLVVEDSIRNR